MLAPFFVKNRWSEGAAEGDEGHLSDSVQKSCAERDLIASTDICNSFSRAQDKLRISQQLGEKASKCNQQFLKEYVLGFEGG